MIEIELNNIKKDYGLKNVLNGVSFNVKTGERIALIGSNGSGKSTILKIIKGEETQDSGALNIRKGSTIEMLNQIYKTEAEDMLVTDFIKQSFKDIFELENNMKMLENKMCIETNTDELQNLINKYGRIQEQYISLGGYEMQEKYNKICSAFKLEESLLNRQYNLLSGGEKTVVNLARILLKNPSILLLDEPTNHLDMQAIEWLEDFLNSYSGTVLLISHDRHFLDKVTTKTILLENGKSKIYFGNYSYFLEEDERRTLAEFERYKSQQKKIEKMQESIKKLRAFGDIAGNEMFFKRAKSIEKRLEKMELIDKVVLEKKKINIELKSCKRSGKDVLRIEELTKKYGENMIFDNINFNLYYQEKVCIKGKNGSGKTTLLNIILGEENDYEGLIKIGSNVKIGYISQEIKFDNEKETIFDFISKIYNKSEREIRGFLMKFMFYKENIFKRLFELSGGEKVRLKLAELMVKDVNLLILDEPTNHLDISTREILEETLQTYKGTILFVSHDRYFINKVANRVVEIKDRKVIDNVKM